jgi:O-antigen ligase
MSIRVLALYLVVAGLAAYAWKDWFKSLCGLLLLMAIIRHEDMPTSVLGIQGLNPWNLLFVAIFLSWALSRRREGLRWDMPRYLTVLLLMYLGVIVIGFLWAAFDRSHIEYYPLGSLLSEELINTVKWVLPGVLLFDGCRTRRRVVVALICLLVMYLLVSVQVARFMPAAAAFGNGDVLNRNRVALGRYIGYTACPISAMLAGASWGIMATLPLVRGNKRRVVVLAAAGVVAYGQALTGGRAGYLAWGAIGLLLCLLKWRRYLILAPVVVIALPIILPGPTARMLSGFGQTDITGQRATDDYAVTSGRTDLWPYVIEKIGESPLIGYGRLAMERSGLVEHLEQVRGEGEAEKQPHNMYLEVMLDNGLVGSLPILLFWGVIVLCSGHLFQSRDALHSAVGGLALSLTLAQLISGIGSQHFYPDSSTMNMWAAVFLALRVHVEEKRMQRYAVVAEPEWDGMLSGRPVVASARWDETIL